MFPFPRHAFPFRVSTRSISILAPPPCPRAPFDEQPRTRMRNLWASSEEFHGIQSTSYRCHAPAHVDEAKKRELGGAKRGVKEEGKLGAKGGETEETNKVELAGQREQKLQGSKERRKYRGAKRAENTGEQKEEKI